MYAIRSYYGPAERCHRAAGEQPEKSRDQRGAGSRRPEGDSSLAGTGPGEFPGQHQDSPHPGRYHGTDPGTIDRRTLFEIDPPEGEGGSACFSETGSN